MTPEPWKPKDIWLAELNAQVSSNVMRNPHPGLAEPRAGGLKGWANRNKKVTSFTPAHQVALPRQIPRSPVKGRVVGFMDQPTDMANIEPVSDLVVPITAEPEEDTVVPIDLEDASATEGLAEDSVAQKGSDSKTGSGGKKGKKGKKGKGKKDKDQQGADHS